MANVYQFALYYSNVDLAHGLTGNLAEIELALRRNPNQFEGIILFDQAKGENNLGKDYKYSSTAFATGWNGTQTEAEGGFSQPVWKETGIARISPSKIPLENLEQLASIAQKDKSTYPEYLIDNLIRTGSSDSDLNYLHFIYGEAATNPLNFNLGISTSFNLLKEMQTGSPASVDYLFEASNSSDLYTRNPHALKLSNHGGSYLYGMNGDGPAFDLDTSERYLQVTELGDSLNQAIDIYSPGQARLGLIAFDECLMANLETATQLADHTRYLLASQEVIPANGYDYFLTLSSFKAKGPLTTQEQIEATSRELGLGFISTYSERNPGEYTLSLTDSNAITELNQAVRQFVNALVNSREEFIVALLKNIKLKGTNYYYGWLQDLGNVALISLSAPGASQALMDASSAILQHLDDAIVANNQNYNPIDGYLENASSGLTITLPTEYSQWQKGDHFRSHPSDIFKAKAPAFEAQTGWSRVIDKIYPLLLEVQTNSATEPSKAKHIDATLTPELGSSAWFALELNGYLSKTSNDPLINRNTDVLPTMQNATIDDLMLELNILTLREPGSVTVAIQDQRGKTKASWTQAINRLGAIEFSAQMLPPDAASQRIEAGDKVVLTPDDTLSARYDLDLKIAGQNLGRLNQSGVTARGSSLFNFSLDLDGSQEISFVTSRLPPASNGNPNTFFTDLVLLSSEDIDKRFTITEQGGESVSFTTDSFIEESVRLESNTAYTFLVEHIQDGSNASAAFSSDIALLINPNSSPAQTLKDSIFTTDVSFNNWGAVTINQDAGESVVLVEMSNNHAITSIDDLQEGESIDASFSSRSINNQTSLRKNADGGSQTFSSGLWSTTSDISLNVFVEGKSANSAKLGFFKVDTLTGAITTAAGLIEPDNSQSYLDAAIDNLIAPMVQLKGFDKEASLEAKFQADQNYAALLITEGISGSTTALFSLANANPTKAVQLLDFGRGYYGFEDYVKGRDLGYDGDFNDITFYTS